MSNSRVSLYYGVFHVGQQIGVVERVVQPSAFLAVLCGLYNKVCGVGNIAKFKCFKGYQIVEVILMNFAANVGYSRQGSVKTLIRANDADIVPHAGPHFFPVVRDDDFFIARYCVAVYPCGDLYLGYIGLAWMRSDPFRGVVGADRRFKKRVAGKAVGSVESGACRFPDSQQTGDVGESIDCCLDPSAAVVRRRDYGNKIRGHVDAERFAFLVYVGEALEKKFFALVANVEIYALDAVRLHFVVNRSGDNVARGEGAALIVSPHERTAVGIDKLCAFAANCFADEKVFRLGVV